MAQGVEEVGIEKQEGCLDPRASNTNYAANSWCTDFVFGASPQPDLGGVYTNGCCTYTIAAVTGCMDPQANNYDPFYVIPCSNCCQYDNTGGGNGGINQEAEIIEDLVFNPGGGTSDPNTDPVPPNPCENIVPVLNADGTITNGNQPITEECCTENLGYGPTDYDSDLGQCIQIGSFEDTGLCESVINGTISVAELQSRVICIDCDNFAWWDNLYSTLNGASLQDVDQDLWDLLVNVITQNPEPGQTTFTSGSFYVDQITGEPIINGSCCNQLQNSDFLTITNDFGEEVSACLCDVEQQLVEFCDCVKTVDLFASIASTLKGRDLILNVTFLTNLGLSLDDANFVVNNLFNPNDNDGDGISDSTQARILISNILFTTGGFYICYQQSQGVVDQENQTVNNTNSSYIQITSEKCTELGGFFDDGVCYCLPQEECTLSLTDLSVTTIIDSFNQQISVVTFNEADISETCCLKIASENNLPWTFETFDGDTRCYSKDPNPCLPLEFNLNREPIIPECDQPLDVSVSFYFGIPENPCVEIDTSDDDVIIVDGEDEPCLLEFDENNNLIDYNSTTQPPVNSGNREDNNTDINLNNDEDLVNNGEPCCYNPANPIEAVLVVKDKNNEIIQSSEPISFTELETWFDISTQVNLTTGSTEYNVALQFTSGLNCCCTYDIYLDNFKFNCSDEQTVTDIIRNNCPGFDIVPVIDNKKSWVYNPGVVNYSNYQNQAGTLTDNVIIKSGDYSLINGYGEINRIFAPSPDADLPWRYTDYFNRSSVLEKHSDLVLNSKELFLTFDMCGEYCSQYQPCPNGYTLSAGTDTCYKYVVSKQYQDDEDFEFQDGEFYDFMDFENP